MKILDWLTSIVTAWMRAKQTGSIEIHFNEGSVTRVIETRAQKPPQ